MFSPEPRGCYLAASCMAGTSFLLTRYFQSQPPSWRVWSAWLMGSKGPCASLVAGSRAKTHPE